MDKRKLQRAADVVCAALALLAMVRSLFVGLEIDEQYALSLAYRLLSGDRLFDTMWEPHQLSALAPVPLLALYIGVTGTTTGVLLFVRAVMLAAKAGLSWWFWRSFRAPLGRTAFWAALVLFAYTPKWFLGPDYISQQFHFTLAAFLCLWQYAAPGPRQYKRPAWVLLAAALACMSYLAFPQSIFAAAFTFAGLWLLGRRGQEPTILRIPRSAVLFLAGCAVCGIAFVVWVLAGLDFSVTALLERALLILSDPQYDFSTGERLARLAAQAVDVVKTLAKPVALLLLAGAALLGWRRSRGEHLTFLRAAEQLLVCAALGALLGCILHAVTDSAVDMRHFTPVLTVLGGWVFWADRGRPEHRAERRLLFWLGYLPGLAAYFFILRSTLLGLAPTFMYLTWSAVCGLLALGLRGETDRRAADLLLGVFLAFLVVCRLWLVMTTGWKDHNAADTPLKRITSGPAAGIWADVRMADKQEALAEALAPYAGRKVLQAIGEVQGLAFLMEDGTLEVGQASVISGTDSDPRFITYYAQLPEKLPDVVLYDTDENRDLADFRAWIEENLDITDRYDVIHGTAHLEVLVIGDR